MQTIHIQKIRPYLVAGFFYMPEIAVGAAEHSHKTVRSKLRGGGKLEGEGSLLQPRLVRMAAMSRRQGRTRRERTRST